jgi:hypothetical protein
VRSDVLALDPSAFAQTLEALAPDASTLAPTRTEHDLLRPDHPFLSFGAWWGFVACRRGQPRARLVASVDPRQRAAGRPVGVLGFFAGVDDHEALATALEAAEGWLRDHGARVVRGPVQFSTWFGHRAMTAGFPAAGGAPVFPFEPANPPALAHLLAGAGYRPAHRAVSHLVSHERVLAGTQRGVNRMRAAGFRERPLDLARLECELGLLHTLALEIFRDSWGYSATSRAEFTAFFAPLARHVDPELVRIAEDPEGRAVGFVLALPASLGNPDGLPRAHIVASGGPASAVVLKTLGVLPDIRRRCPGLGSALTAIVHEVARRDGYTHGIHALMAEGSYAQRTSAGWGHRLRAYATFERDFDPGASQ